MPCRCKVNLSRYHKLSWMLQNVLNHLSEGGRMILNTIFQVLRCIGIRNDIWTLIVFSWLCSLNFLLSSIRLTLLMEWTNVRLTMTMNLQPKSSRGDPNLKRKTWQMKKSMRAFVSSTASLKINEKKNWLYYFNQNLFVSTFASQYELSPLHLLHSEFIKLKWMQGSHLSVKEVCKLLFL